MIHIPGMLCFIRLMHLLPGCILRFSQLMEGLSQAMYGKRNKVFYSTWIIRRQVFISFVFRMVKINMSGKLLFTDDLIVIFSTPEKRFSTIYPQDSNEKTDLSSSFLPFMR